MTTNSLQPLEEELLPKEARAFLRALHEKFNPERLHLLEARTKRQQKLSRGEKPNFIPETASIRNDLNWKVATPPEEIQTRFVEITGPTDAKMVINALNSGANIFMADFEDASVPTWKNILEGQKNLREAIRGTLQYRSPEGKEYKLQENRAVLFLRPRGWHLEEAHLQMSGSLFDFGLYFFWNAKELLTRGSRPYFYLAKLENHEEARLWNEVFSFSEDYFQLPRGTIRATVLVETILAAFEMEEILFVLKEHSAGLNAGRWDYLFSIIKKFQADQTFLLPDRAVITMKSPFMQAYTRLLTQICDRRGAQAIGGMAAFIPNRKDLQVTENALKRVLEDKEREVSEGFVGTWVAHPDLVSLAKSAFEKPHQKPSSAPVTADELLNFQVAGKITEAGLRLNLDVSLRYLDSWLKGVGAVAIYNLMEDTATAEISRSQVWQWLHHNAKLESGVPVTETYVKTLLEEEYKKQGEPLAAKALLEKLLFTPEFIDFLTLPAYAGLPCITKTK